MNKTYFAAGILVICFISLIMGILQPQNNERQSVLSAEDNKFLSMDNQMAGDKIALLNIDGVISASGGKGYLSNEFNVDNFIETLDRAKTDKSVKAIMIRINSPGGTVAASQDIYDAIILARGLKPVVVYMGDVCASGGYYIASAADRIVAQKGSMTGSIGVIMNFTDMADLSKKIGITSNTIKSGKFKDSGSMSRKMTSDERKLFQNSIDTAYGQFIEAIKQGRINRKHKDYDEVVERKELTMQTLKQYADGRVLLGEEAYKLGFVDTLGSQREAKLLISDMVHIMPGKLQIVPYNKNNFQTFLMNLEGKLNSPLENLLPFSVIHNRQPLMIME